MGEPSGSETHLEGRWNTPVSATETRGESSLSDVVKCWKDAERELTHVPGHSNARSRMTGKVTSVEWQREKSDLPGREREWGTGRSSSQEGPTRI